MREKCLELNLTFFGTAKYDCDKNNRITPY